MATAVQKIAQLSNTRDIPFNKLVLSQANVRRVKANVSVEDLAESIARRGLLQNLNVRPVLDAEGQETGTFEVPAGGRRYRALELLVKSKRLAKTAPVPCNVREAASEISAEEDSLAENTHREDLHPLDQFRAFKALVDAGQGIDDVAARFFVSPTVVRQRLKLASVAPALLDAYADDAMTLEQLMAFTVSPDQARQAQVWQQVRDTYQKDGYYIRRLLTESSVATSDRRAVFVGVEAYEAAGGRVSRDLFSEDRGGWLDDVALLDRLVSERLAREAEMVGAEGWKWVEAALDFTYGHASGLRRFYGRRPEISDEEQAAHEARTDELECLFAAHERDEDVSDEVVAQAEALEAAIDAFNNPPVFYDPAEVALGGAFVTVDHQGRLRVERGFVRPLDEAPITPEGEQAQPSGEPAPRAPAVITVGGQTEPDEGEDDGALKPLSEKLVTELTAAKTVALRDAVGRDPDAARLAVLHALCLPVFYSFGHDSCLELSARPSGFSVQAPGLKDSASAQAIEARHAFWAQRLPKRSGDLWPALVALGPDERQLLFAHAASATVNVTREPFNRRSPGALAHGEVLARHVGLDMAEAGWRPTAENYLGRVPKARILEAVRETKGEMAAQLIDHLKKPEMAKEAERLLADTGWVPEPLKVAGAEAGAADPAGEPEALPAFLADDEDPTSDDEPAEPDPEPFAIAAE
ncbi:MAG: ParB/RepB/Spo0J family partition protein [Sphingomonadaceae bacterium]|nr:ParB/RepB/Spo0J family partition protein [Sphingomonadaceae bacterium]